VRQIVAFFVDNVILLVYHFPALTSEGYISTSLSKDNEEEQPVHTGKIIINATSIITKIIATQLKLRFR
jgi:hypothetical protein